MSYLTSNSLTIKNLSFERNNHYLFENLHKEIVAGEILQLRGENGSGKSTLLRILAGFLTPHEGTVCWQLENPEDEYQQHIHYIGHQNALRPRLSVYENLILSASLTLKKIDETQIKKILAQVYLQKSMHVPAFLLSAGQQRRLSLAKLILAPAALWILDEPITALDHQGQAFLLEIMDKHLDDKGIIVVATHQTLLTQKPLQTLHLGKHYV